MYALIAYRGADTRFYPDLLPTPQALAEARAHLRAEAARLGHAAARGSLYQLIEQPDGTVEKKLIAHLREAVRS